MKKVTLSFLIALGATCAMSQNTPVLSQVKQIPTPPVGILENTPNLEFVIYPNPVSTVLNVEVDYKGHEVFATILDMTGRVIFSKVLLLNGANTIEIADLNSGAYFCRFSITDKVIKLQRFIVK